MFPLAHQRFLDAAAEPHRTQARQWLSSGDWQVLQEHFLDMVDGYIEAELARPADHLVQFHEAGGNWRIAFPHQQVRPDDRVAAHLERVMAARQAFVDANYHAGFPDECEVHHDMETFLYFQMPLYHSGMPGAEAALRSIRRVADHCGNWSSDVPRWYDWDTPGFRSTWIGTRHVRAHPPFDYQEANHFRLVDLCTTAWAASGERRYLDLLIGYADRWCEHIERHAAADGPIPCQILPEGAKVTELGRAGAAAESDAYQIFYATMAANTVYDIVMALLDVYRITGERRYLRAFEAMVRPMFDHGRGGRPAMRFTDGQWQHPTLGVVDDGKTGFNQGACFIARMALKHDLLTGASTYREPVLAWAAAIDETQHTCDQAACDVMVAAHHYTGDPAWLARGYAMALRTWAVAETNEGAHGGNGANCSAATRYGSKFLFELLYTPLTGECDWGTRGNLPLAWGSAAALH